MTNPSLPRSKGRQAPGGSSFLELIARMSAKAPKVRGDRGASTPPVMATSTTPSRMSRNPSPIPIVPDAQLIAFVELGPWNPNAMAMLQLAAPQKTVSARRGSTARIPRFRNVWNSPSACAIPPRAEPICTAARSPGTLDTSKQASSTA